MASTPRRKRQFANQDDLDKVEVRSQVAEADQECADWKLQIKLAQKRNETWEHRCEDIIKRYREQRSGATAGMGGAEGAQVDKRRMNILWSNVQTLMPCVYGRQPVPIAERRFLDRDDTGRVGSQILERALRYEMNFCGFHDTVEMTVLDYLLVGRGVPWLRFVPIIGPASSFTDRGNDELTDRMGEPESEEDTPHPERDEEEASDEPTEESPEAKLLSASLDVDYVHWKDFYHSKCRFWKENTWVGRRLYPSRKDLIDYFGDEIGNAVPLEMTPENSKDDRTSTKSVESPDSAKKAIIYEIWDKSSRKVYTVAEGYDQFLEDPREDPLNLEKFFPCPKPLFATMTNDTLEPVPDYLEYQDQALEIDELTNRISQLIKALKVAGVYDASFKELQRLLDEGGENQLIPVPGWAARAEKGGIPAAISWLPVKEVADTLQGLFDARDKIKADLFEITGLSDILRGQADPRETAQAVATKGRWGSLRLQARQANVARYCRDIICMMGEIISEHFPDETLINVSGAMYDEGIGGPEPVAPDPPEMPSGASPMLGHNGGPPMGNVPPAVNALPPLPAGPGMAPAPVVQQAHPIIQSLPGALPPAGGTPSPVNPIIQYAMAMQKYQRDMAKHQAEKQALISNALALLRQDKLRGFRIDIETDSTVSTDANEEKQSRTEFLTAMTGFLDKSFQIAQQVPEAVPMLGKMILFGVRGFRTGRDLESTIEEFIDKMEKMAAAKEGMPPPPNPEIQKQQMELQAIEAKSQAEVKKAQIDAQSSAEDNQRDIASKQADAALAQQQMQADVLKMHQEARFRQAEFEQKMELMRMQMATEQHTHQQTLEQSQRMHEQKMEQLHVGHQQALEKMRQPKEKAGAEA